MQPFWVALIPSYQPTEQLIPLLQEARSAGFQIVVIDDGSCRDTKDLFAAATRFGTVLHHLQNLGKGQAIKTRISFIQNQYPADCIIVTLDADGQHRVADAQKICQIAQNHPETLVLGSRKLKENVPLRSRFGNAVTRFVYYIATGQKVWDTQTGLRAFSAKLIPQLLTIPGERYEYEMNVLLACARTGLPILEEEIDTIYIDANASSHFHAVKDSWRVYQEILKFSAASSISFLADCGLYSLFTFLTSHFGSLASILASNIGAGAISACIHYTLNRKLAFQGEAYAARTAVQYAVLAGALLMGNTLLLSFLAACLGVNRYAAKLAAESFFCCFAGWLRGKKSCGSGRT